tara:strand:- start:4589 stop:4918 length:330 start_codon:yes stop_codon:yes gene_type:complete
MKITEAIKKLCTPAFIYFAISIFSFLVMIIQNFGNTNSYCVGPYECYVSNTSGVFLVKFLYILFFTWLLNVFCKAGYSSVSWFLVLLPFILMFVLIAGFILKNAGQMVV